MTDHDLTRDQVLAIARLSRLHVDDTAVEGYRVRMAALLDYVRRLSELDLRGVEPLANPVAERAENRLDADEPGPVLPLDTVMRLAPDRMEPFVRVPKVLGGEGS